MFVDKRSLRSPMALDTDLNSVQLYSTHCSWNIWIHHSWIHWFVFWLSCLASEFPDQLIARVFGLGTPRPLSFKWHWSEKRRRLERHGYIERKESKNMASGVGATWRCVWQHSHRATSAIYCTRLRTQNNSQRQPGCCDFIIAYLHSKGDFQSKHTTNQGDLWPTRCVQKFSFNIP